MTRLINNEEVKIKSFLWSQRTVLPESFAQNEVEAKTDMISGYLLMAPEDLDLPPQARG